MTESKTIWHERLGLVLAIIAVAAIAIMTAALIFALSWTLILL